MKIFKETATSNHCFRCKNDKTVKIKIFKKG